MITNRRNRIVHAVVLILALLLAQGATAESSAKPNDPSAFIEQLASQAIKVLSSPNGSLRDRENKFRDLLRDDFAMDQIGRFVAGSYWRQMSPEQRETYQKLFSEWVLKTYSVRLGGYSGERFQVIKATPAGENDFIVHTRINKQGGDGFNANWRVRRTGDRYKIIDVYVEGVSMAITQRSEFDSLFKRHGVDGMLAILRDKVSQLSASS